MAWLSLIPVTDEQTKTNKTTTSASPSSSDQNQPHYLQNPFQHQHHNHDHQHQQLHQHKHQHHQTSLPIKNHNHNHYPTANSILKSIVSDTNSLGSRKRSTGNLNKCRQSSGSNLILPLLEDPSKRTGQNQNLNNQSSFEIRELQPCDIDRVKELHSSSLPVSYPTWFFYDLLRPGSYHHCTHQVHNQHQAQAQSRATGPTHGDRIEKICLVATLPASNNGYFETFSSASHSSSSHHKFNNAHAAHLPPFHPHHVTSPLSGKEPISLDIVGSITAKIDHDRYGDEDRFRGRSIRILTLCVKEEYKSMGIGKSLINSLIQTFSSGLYSNFLTNRNNHHHQRRFSNSNCSQTSNSTNSDSEAVEKSMKINGNGNNSDKSSIDKQNLRLNLHVQASNWIGLKFYLSSGFKIRKFKKDYYRSSSFNDLEKTQSSSKSTTTKLKTKDGKDVKRTDGVECGEIDDEECIIREIEKMYLDDFMKDKIEEEDERGDQDLDQNRLDNNNSCKDTRLLQDQRRRKGRRRRNVEGINFRIGNKFDSYFLDLEVD